MTSIRIYFLVFSFFLFFCIIFLCVLPLSSVGSSLLLYPCKVQYAPLFSILFMFFWGVVFTSFFPFNVSYRILFSTLINKFYPGPPLSIVFLFLLLYLLIFLSLRSAEPSVSHYPGKVHPGLSSNFVYLSFLLYPCGGRRVVRWCWVNFQCRGVLQFGLQ